MTIFLKCVNIVFKCHVCYLNSQKCLLLIMQTFGYIVYSLKIQIFLETREHFCKCHKLSYNGTE